ncbi:Polypyrimidine tract-binding protein 2 [Fasciola gigantica]|uniref:Polypyrimidine tract-binding protein 2 n=1 Tax=Fasciola gigantica TaxID=46835 RepID=A0A504Z5X8_FASGI|nr:Polypyrimidine tract-binding protein 2 [Fasciola gigantica]
MSTGAYSALMSSKRKRDATNGFIMNGDSHAPMDTESNENKKSRMEYVETVPSKVVHIRNMPNDASEQEIALLGIPFGMLENMVLSKKAGQALIEMQSLESAIHMVSYYREYQVTLRGRNLVMQFSKHQHLELHSENTNIGDAIKNANCIVQQDLCGANCGIPNTVLRVLVDNIMGQQINHTILHKIFYRYGKILRIITYLKNNQYHGLIEFENHIHAFVAMLHLNGQNIYTGCCSLRVEFSKNRGPLEVRHENDKCRDYIINPLSEEELINLRRYASTSVTAGTSGGNVSHGGTAGMMQHFQGAVVPGMTPQGLHLPVGMIAPPSTSNSGINDLTAQLAALAQQSGLALTPAAVAATASFMAMTAQNNAVSAQSVPNTPNLAALLAAIQGGAVQNPLMSHLASSNTGTLGSHSLNQTNSAPGGRPPPNNNGGTVLIVSNLHEESLKTTHLTFFPSSFSFRSTVNLGFLPVDRLFDSVILNGVFTVINFVVSIRLPLFLLHLAALNIHVICQSFTWIHCLYFDFREESVSGRSFHPLCVHYGVVRAKSTTEISNLPTLYLTF